MTKFFKRLLPILLVCILLLSFAGCEFLNSLPGAGGGSGQTPTEPVDPDGPITPDDPEDPIDPDDPVDPDDPINPDDPVDPDDPIDPDDPVDPTPTDTFFFSDEKSAQNTAFYKDYSEEEKALYYRLWSEDTQISLEIDIEPSELLKIQEAYYDYVSTGNSTKADTYRRCNLTVIVDGVRYYYEEVGVRMRGNTSRRDFCDQDGNIYAYVHLRFDLGETFDGEEYEDGAWGADIRHEWTDDEARSARKDRTFATLEKFYYKWNKNYDNTYMREVYANRMFQAYGILAPHITVTQISMKQGGEMRSLGVGNLYETIDKHFLKRHFSKEERSGDLYKCTYTNGRADLNGMHNYGVETPTQRFNYSLKTNDDRSDPDYNHNKYLRALMDALAASPTSPTFKTNLEALVDMDYFARFEAVNYLLGNPDCIRNNSNNYYLYFLPTTGQAIFIPYDYDRCLGINMDWNPSGNGMTTAAPLSTRSPNGDVSCPLYTKTILSSGDKSYQTLYMNAISKILEGEWFTYEHFRAIYLKYAANYQAVATPDSAIVQAVRDHVRTDCLAFSEGGASDFGRTDQNISTADYMSAKRLTAQSALENFFK